VQLDNTNGLIPRHRDATVNQGLQKYGKDLPTNSEEFLICQFTFVVMFSFCHQFGVPTGKFLHPTRSLSGHTPQNSYPQKHPNSKLKNIQEDWSNLGKIGETLSYLGKI